ncbi:glycosyltransferase [Bifidobacterium sp. SO1]|uniref:glycosyltransferase family 2 protein n=1 Tax=Bifidobacterium sp. SO1 TaxID=2809029 RepID=UPI001BDC43B7|nr:glycosyltransferase [Bifidobacterium sp. SO1]MBT1161483.1 glycosyltransferase [Bifidobacterium sp. SO1]
MLTPLNNRTYQVTIDAIEHAKIGDQSKTVISGWSVDKMRKTALPLAVEDRRITVSRQPRIDIDKIYDLDAGEQAGFKIIVPDGIDTFKLLCNTPGGAIAKSISVSKIFGQFRKEYVFRRMDQMLYYITHLWTPKGMKAFMGAVKRRFVKEQTFYESWIKRHETMSRQDAEKIMASFTHKPLISVVTPVYNVDEVWLRKCVDSMRDQWYDNWELCLADDHSPSPHVRPLLKQLAESDHRIKIVFREENGRIAKATNSAIELATGDYIGFMDNDDELAPQALFEVVRALNEHPDTDFVYTDEDKIDEKGTRFDPFFKPDYSPNLLLGHNYITHFVVVGRELLNKVGPLRSEYDGSQDYDFVLRATEQAHRVHHIPQMLYHWRTLASSVAGDPRSKMYAYEAGRKALESALRRRGITGTVRMLDNLGTYKIDYAVGAPSVAVLASSYSEDQLKRLRAMTDYPAFSVIPVTPDTVNATAESRTEDLIVLLNGLKPDGSSWLHDMVNYSLDGLIGVIGGKIFDTKKRVVNVGVTLRALRQCEPFEMRGEWDEGIGYYFRDLLPRDMFAVTEDCMLARRKEFIELGGLDTRLKPGLRGIDYCARMYQQTGHTVLWQPYSVFIDAKKSHLTIDKTSCIEYLKMHRNLADPFASVCFPPSDHEQNGIASSIDSVDVSSDGSIIRVTGWAADLHEGEEVSIALADSRWAMLSDVERYGRPDVNSALPVPANAILGFHAEIAVSGGRKHLVDAKPALVLSTPTDTKKVDIKVQASPVLAALASFGRKAALMRHPRSTVRRLIDKYWAPRRQRQMYQKLIVRTERYDLAQVERDIAAFSYKPCISLLVPVYNVEPRWLEKCVDSVLGQYYSNWELCLADDHSTEPHVRPLLEQYVKRDPRIKVVFREENGHISKATNSALEIATGEFVGLLDNDDELAPQALYEVVKLLNRHPDTDLIYSDEDKEDEEGHRSDPHFKPDYSPDLLLSTNYISHFGVYRKSIVDEIGGFRAGYEGSQDYDLVLRFVEKTDPSRIRHIAKVLYYWRTLATSTASSGGAKSYASDAGLRALRSAVKRRGIAAQVVPSLAGGIYHVHYDIASRDLVSVIIPTKNGYDNIERCVSSIIDKTDYGNYEIIIADNGSSNPNMWNLYKRYQQKLGDRFRVEEIDIPFNFSRINNMAAEKANGKYLLFLNDDTEVISPSWMTRMVSFAQLDRIGVVGAKLYYPTETIQHAGIVLGLGGAAGHIQVGFPRSYFGYFGRLIENVNYYAVTAACCMVKAEDFRAVGGFDEVLAVAYNDVDLCIRIHDQLHRDNVWSCETELYHYESVTRGYDVESKNKKARLEREAAKFQAKYHDIVENDPYYNPNLSRTSGNYWVKER